MGLDYKFLVPFQARSSTSYSQYSNEKTNKLNCKFGLVRRDFLIPWTSPTMIKRPLTEPFSEEDGRGWRIRLVGRSEMKVVIGNILSEDFVAIILDLKHKKEDRGNEIKAVHGCVLFT